jgi:hypothetical protein
MKTEIDKLQSHPLNKMIYGHEDNTELLEKIKSSGWIKPILITRNFTIISGHRRVEVCKLLGITEIECEILDEDDPLKLMEIMLAENAYRVKTNIQLLRESKIYFDIEKKKAYQREIAGVKPEANLPHGRTTEIVAEKIGMSESSFKKGQKVISKIEEEEDPMIKWLFENTTNQSIDSAMKLTGKPIGFIQSVIDKTGGDKDKIPSAIREVEVDEMKEKSNLPPGKYQVIYIDLTGKNIDGLYQTLISDICEEDCVLFLWVIPKQLEEGLKISKYLGFHYQTCLVWNRDVLNEVSDFGEILLVSVKGNPQMIFTGAVAGSAEKPSIVREMIDKWYKASKVELFVGEGWEIW